MNPEPRGPKTCGSGGSGSGFGSGSATLDKTEFDLVVAVKATCDLADVGKILGLESRKKEKQPNFINDNCFLFQENFILWSVLFS
jgi:hypothetical protein